MSHGLVGDCRFIRALYVRAALRYRRHGMRDLAFENIGSARWWKDQERYWKKQP